MAKAASRGTRSRKKKTIEPTGLSPAETVARAPKSVEDLAAAIEEDGGKPLAQYREPLGGHWVIFAALPIEQVEPTPYQRGLSDAHVKRLTEVIRKTNRYLDPVIAIRADAKKYQTPNGHHRANAMKMIGARTITALVVTEPEVARLILALNCEKAHNLREKCHEVVKLARDLSTIAGLKESDLSLELEEAAFLTLGLCYEERPRFAGGAYHPLLKRVDELLDVSLAKAITTRGGYVKTLLAVDDLVAEHVAALKEKGFESPYLKSFVVARLNPIRFLRGATMPIEEALEKMLQAAKRFDSGKIKVTDIARSGGAAQDEGSGG